MDFRVKKINVRDLLPLLEIERLSYCLPWRGEQFWHFLKQKNRFGVVATLNEVVAGFMLVEAMEKHLVIHGLAVHPQMRRRGVGKRLLGWLNDTGHETGREKLRMEIPESATAAQLFMRACGWKAIEVLRNYYSSGDSAYVFVRELHKPDYQ